MSNKKRYKVIFASDFHGKLVCKPSLQCLLNLLKDNKDIDEVVLNGDILDFPYLSRHHKKLYKKGPFRNYSEIDEIEFVKNEILAPLKKSTKAKIVFRLGNHEERVTQPLTLTQDQLERLAVVHEEYGTTKLDKMLCLSEIGIEYDPKPVRNYFHVFDAVHGLSLAKSAGRNNIYEYMGSGTSGHSHRLGVTYINNKHSSYCWIESGCMRIKEAVEYLPTAKIADWSNGFVEVTFDLTNPRQPLFFASPHAIVNGKCEYGGKIYSA